MTNRAALRVDAGELGPTAARRFIRETLAGWNQDQIFDAELLVSELMTIAALHDPTAAVNVVVSSVGTTLRIEVSDPHRGFTDGRSVSFDDAATYEPPNGLGLRIVDWVAPRWGVDLDDPGKTVWFELEPVAS